MFTTHVVEFWDNSIESATVQLAKYLEESQGKAILVAEVGRIVNGTFMIEAIFTNDNGDQ